ncbi:hypothetical protein [Conexibacter sp. SYSU D00693]|uniref:DUF7674 family protein n=1 Tax=Conexibacter sp. SYSU D00693 TaxID=2812560 RepID=UPI00196B2997|nr:hypothetical protein [Conexibacter sp. SYSU D00693]
MTGHEFSDGEHRVVAQTDGDWWVLGFPDDERPRAITEDRLLAGALSDLFGSDAAEPLLVASRLATVMLCTKAAVPSRERTQADGRPATEVAAIDWLVEQVPELAPILDAHMDYMEELLSYVVFESDFTRWFVDAVKTGNDHMARRFCDAIEWLMATKTEPAADDPVWNLAGVCFTEALVMGGEDEVVARARPWFGEATTRDIDYMLRQRGT